MAASDVSNSGSQSIQAVTSAVAPVASQQTSSIISGAVSGALRGVGGGFAPSGGAGGFSPSGGSGGGFAPSGGAGGFSPSGGSGGFAPSGGGGSGGGNTGGGSGGGFAPGGGGGSGGQGGGSGGQGGGTGPGGQAPADTGGRANSSSGYGGPNGDGPSVAGGALVVGRGGVPADKPLPEIAFASTRSGRAAGDGAADTGLWMQATGSLISKTEAGLKLHGKVYNGLVGIDHRFTEDFLGGLAVGYENSNIVTAYNNGNFKGSGVSLAPYVGIVLSSAWTVDLSGGYSWLRYDVDRTNKAVSGSYDANRVFGSSNLTGSYAVSDWRFQPTVGVQFSREYQNAYTETGNAAVAPGISKTGRASGGSKIGYALENGVPYVKILGEWDFLMPKAVLKGNGDLSRVDRYGGVFGIGYEHYMGGFVGSAELNYNSLLRQDLDLWTAALRARWDF